MSRLHSFVLAAFVGLVPLAAQAQLHDGDIEMQVTANQIVLEGHAVLRLGNGYQVFEGDFGDVAGGPFKTDDPGFDSAPGTWADGAVVNYLGLGSLEFWNGASWVAAGLQRVTLDGNLGEATVFQGSGLSGDMSGLIGQSGSSGQIHEHLDMSVSMSGGGLPTMGAYLIQLQVVSSGMVSSQPFYIALNRGLDDAAFENAVQALAVPEPQTWLLLGAGFAGVIVAARRRR